MERFDGVLISLKATIRVVKITKTTTYMCISVHTEKFKSGHRVENPLALTSEPIACSTVRIDSPPVNK
jgi:hypothetical protein